MAKRKRQPNRTPREKLEDDFADLTLSEQTEMLKTFATLLRQKRRFVEKIAESAIEAGAEAAELLPLEATK